MTSHAIIIPCYNEAERLHESFIAQLLTFDESTSICFVNDGSIDNTGEILEKIKKTFPESVHIIHLSSNAGKGSAVRVGALWSVDQNRFSDIGYLDADMSVLPEDYLTMLTYHRERRNDITYASRLKIPYNELQQTILRSFISRMSKFLTVFILKIKVNDSQCGAKILNSDVALDVFKDSFKSRWLFDIELFKRAQYGNKTIRAYYLKQWHFRKRSKIRWIDIMIFIPLEFIRILIFR